MLPSQPGQEKPRPAPPPSTDSPHEAWPELSQILFDSSNNLAADPLSQSLLESLPDLDFNADTIFDAGLPAIGPPSQPIPPPLSAPHSRSGASHHQNLIPDQPLQELNGLLHPDLDYTLPSPLLPPLPSPLLGHREGGSAHIDSMGITHNCLVPPAVSGPHATGGSSSAPQLAPQPQPAQGARTFLPQHQPQTLGSSQQLPPPQQQQWQPRQQQQHAQPQADQAQHRQQLPLNHHMHHEQPPARHQQQQQQPGVASSPPPSSSLPTPPDVSPRTGPPLESPQQEVSVEYNRYMRLLPPPVQQRFQGNLLRNCIVLQQQGLPLEQAQLVVQQRQLKEMHKIAHGMMQRRLRDLSRAGLGAQLGVVQEGGGAADPRPTASGGGSTRSHSLAPPFESLLPLPGSKGGVGHGATAPLSASPAGGTRRPWTQGLQTAPAPVHAERAAPEVEGAEVAEDARLPSLAAWHPQDAPWHSDVAASQGLDLPAPPRQRSRLEESLSFDLLRPAMHATDPTASPAQRGKVLGWVGERAWETRPASSAQTQPAASGTAADSSVDKRAQRGGSVPVPSNCTRGGRRGKGSLDATSTPALLAQLQQAQLQYQREREQKAQRTQLAATSLTLQEAPWGGGGLPDFPTPGEPGRGAAPSSISMGRGGEAAALSGAAQAQHAQHDLSRLVPAGSPLDDAMRALAAQQVAPRQQKSIPPSPPPLPVAAGELGGGKLVKEAGRGEGEAVAVVRDRQTPGGKRVGMWSSRTCSRCGGHNGAKCEWTLCAECCRQAGNICHVHKRKKRVKEEASVAVPEESPLPEGLSSSHVLSSQVAPSAPCSDPQGIPTYRGTVVTSKLAQRSAPEPSGHIRPATLHAMQQAQQGAARQDPQPPAGREADMGGKGADAPWHGPQQAQQAPPAQRLVHPELRPSPFDEYGGRPERGATHAEAAASLQEVWGLNDGNGGGLGAEPTQRSAAAGQEPRQQGALEPVPGAAPGGPWAPAVSAGAAHTVPPYLMPSPFAAVPVRGGERPIGELPRGLHATVSAGPESQRTAEGAAAAARGAAHAGPGPAEEEAAADHAANGKPAPCWSQDDLADVVRALQKEHEEVALWKRAVGRRNATVGRQQMIEAVERYKWNAAMLGELFDGVPVDKCAAITLECAAVVDVPPPQQQEQAQEPKSTPLRDDARRGEGLVSGTNPMEPLLAGTGSGAKDIAGAALVTHPPVDLLQPAKKAEPGDKTGAAHGAGRGVGPDPGQAGEEGGEGGGEAAEGTLGSGVANDVKMEMEAAREMAEGGDGVREESAGGTLGQRLVEGAVRRLGGREALAWLGAEGLLAAAEPSSANPSRKSLHMWRQQQWFQGMAPAKRAHLAELALRMQRSNVAGVLNRACGAAGVTLPPEFDAAELLRQPGRTSYRL